MLAASPVSPAKVLATSPATETASGLTGCNHPGQQTADLGTERRASVTLFCRAHPPHRLTQEWAAPSSTSPVPAQWPAAGDSRGRRYTWPVHRSRRRAGRWSGAGPSGPGGPTTGGQSSDGHEKLRRRSPGWMAPSRSLEHRPSHQRDARYVPDEPARAASRPQCSPVPALRQVKVMVDEFPRRCRARVAGRSRPANATHGRHADTVGFVLWQHRSRAVPKDVLRWIRV